MKKKLKIWNGRGFGHQYNGHSAFVAAYSAKQASELLSTAFFGRADRSLVSVYEISKYYSKGCWGIYMAGIEPVEPCVYLRDNSHTDNKVFRVI